MNRLLSGFLSLFNAIYAIVIVASFPYVWGAMGYNPLAGLAIGIIVAVFTCGIVAILTLMEKHLRRVEEHLQHIANSADYQNKLMQMSAERQVSPKS
jgi:uncharacterized membrane protein